jgi:hypothetical protein
MTRNKCVQALKARLRIVNNQIDQIVLNGGRVSLSDPLTREMYSLTSKIAKLKFKKNI